MQDGTIAESLARLYAAHRQELFTYALSITGVPASAEDAVHDAFSRMLAKPHLPREPRPYVFRCVRNAALDALRYSAREQQKQHDYLLLFDALTTPNPADTATAAALLAMLNEKEREILVLKIYAGLTFREIATVCGARQGTVAALYWRSLQKLRKHASDQMPFITPLLENES